MSKRLIVLDLDGTLIDHNSFIFFCLILLRLSFYILKRSSIIAAVRIIAFSILRKFRICSHGRLKAELQRVWSLYENLGYKALLNIELVKYLERYLRTDVVEFVSHMKTSDDTVLLATAAPKEYVELIVKEVSIIDIYHATTGINDGAWVHNIGKQKWQRISDLIADANTTVISFTDSADDLPLIENSDVAYIFPPLSNNIEKLIDNFGSQKIKSFYH